MAHFFVLPVLSAAFAPLSTDMSLPAIPARQRVFRLQRRGLDDRAATAGCFHKKFGPFEEAPPLPGETKGQISVDSIATGWFYQ
jgi:hypothetical protein